jgi:hypothetical protein
VTYSQDSVIVSHLESTIGLNKYPIGPLSKIKSLDRVLLWSRTTENSFGSLEASPDCHSRGDPCFPWASPSASLVTSSSMQHKITLTPLVVEEPHLNWLAAQPNIMQNVQAAEFVGYFIIL